MVESSHFTRDLFVVWPLVVTAAPFSIYGVSSAHTKKTASSRVKNALCPALPLLLCPLSSTTDYQPRFPKLIIDILFLRDATENTFFFLLFSTPLATCEKQMLYRDKIPVSRMFLNCITKIKPDYLMDTILNYQICFSPLISFVYSVYFRCQQRLTGLRHPHTQTESNTTSLNTQEE